jgi:serine/threonine-protein kinase
MELLEGRTLKQLVDEEGGVPWERGRQLLLQLADGLEAVHSHGIIHRDLKPDNVFVIDRGRGRELCKIIDFGIAKTTELDDRAQSFTRTGMVFGTPAFMSPEQARGEAVDARSDIYAFGCIAFHLLTGVRPFEGNTPTEVLYKHLFTEAPSLRQVAPGRDIPAGTEAVVLKCLRKDRELRFPDMRTLREALTGVGTTTPMVIVPSERLPTPPGFAPPPGLAPPAARPPTPAELSAWQVGTGSSRMAPPPTATGGWATSTGSAALASQGVAEAEGTRARTGSGRTIALVAAAAVALGVGVGGTVLWLGDPNPASAPAAAEAAGAPASPSPGTTAAAVVGSGLPAGVVTPTSVPAADAGPPPDPTVESSASTAAVAPTGGGGARGSARPTAGAVAPSAATPPGLPSVAPEAAPDPAGPPAEPPPPAEPAPAEGDFSAPAASAPVPDPPKKKPRPAADGDLLDPFKQH